MSDRPYVTIAREDDLAVVSIDRPERRNALNSAAACAVADSIEEAGRTARVIILTGSGGSFCAGGDLEELERWSHLSEDEIATSLYKTFQQMVRSIRASTAVVIAAVDGPAVGAGMDLALACDLRIASDRSRFGQVWVTLGVIPGTGGAWLTQMLAGQTKAAELLLTGKIIDADEAKEAGLVNRVVPSGDLMDEAKGVASSILRHPREGVVANKKAMVAATHTAVEAALAHAAEVQPGRFTSAEFQDAVRSARSRSKA
jgi:2-(1,2-epoxy-1,2-dihydrophenyl)acetyl-CoA isomerase